MYTFSIVELTKEEYEADADYRLRYPNPNWHQLGTMFVVPLDYSGYAECIEVFGYTRSEAIASLQAYQDSVGWYAEELS